MLIINEYMSDKCHKILTRTNGVDIYLVLPCEVLNLLPIPKNFPSHYLGHNDSLSRKTINVSINAGIA